MPATVPPYLRAKQADFRCRQRQDRRTKEAPPKVAPVHVNGQKKGQRGGAMKSFLVLVGVAAVAGAMYVAGASGSQQVKWAPQSEVVALQSKVKTLTIELNKKVAPEANAALGIISDCYLTVSGSTATANGLGVSQFGGTSSGFLFGATSTSSTPRTALDVATSSPTYDLQEVTPACVSGHLARHGALGSSSSSLLGLGGRTH
jgi:hypothetical protein